MTPVERRRLRRETGVVAPDGDRAMANDTFPMTVEGHKALKEELQRLKTVERPAIIAQVAEARANGDLSENAEYAAARERHGFIESRIAMVEGQLARAQVIDTSNLSGDRVVFGATVTI